jgi:tRNA dimethylallyltransferase
MLERGWLHEVETLLESGLAENAKPFAFIGYRELRHVLRKELSLEQAHDAIHQATRQYAKRQLTWFRKDAGVRWFSGFGDDPELQTGILQYLQSLEPLMAWFRRSLLS